VKFAGRMLRRPAGRRVVMVPVRETLGAVLASASAIKRRLRNRDPAHASRGISVDQADPTLVIPGLRARSLPGGNLPAATAVAANLPAANLPAAAAATAAAAAAAGANVNGPGIPKLRPGAR